MKKTFNIGECALYGRWTIEVTPVKIKVQGKDWTTKKVEEERTCTHDAVYDFSLEEYLTDVSTSYHADQMMDWIKLHVPKPTRKGTWT